MFRVKDSLVFLSLENDEDFIVQPSIGCLGSGADFSKIDVQGVQLNMTVAMIFEGRL